LRPPTAGTLLKTIRVTDHVAGVSTVIEVRQGDRRNGIAPQIFGRPMFPHRLQCGFDLFFRALRRRWALRWIVG
jgi:hypothetical protein